MDDRVDHSVDGLAQRKRHRGVGIQNRPLGEKQRAVDRIFALRYKNKARPESTLRALLEMTAPQLLSEPV